MMKNTINMLSVLVIFLIFAADGCALEKRYLLKKGRIAADKGRTQEAIEYYQEYIESHPVTKGDSSSQYNEKKQYYIKNLLTAYSNVLDIYRQNREIDEIDKWINKLKDIFLTTNFGSKNMYNLAGIYIDNNLSEDATVLFKQIIKEQKKHYEPYNNKVTLRAYSKLLKRYESQGENENVIELIDSLKSSYPVSDFDLKDEYRLAVLYLKYGSETDGEELLKQIIDEIASDYGPSNVNTLVKTYAKLLKIYQKRKDKESIDSLIKQISQKYFIESLSPGNLYKLAITCLKCGKKKQGSTFLEDISNGYSHTTYGRKALFLLGRTSQSREDWDSAIKYFSKYIERYPDPPFFALKAYSRLIDSYWSRDANLELAQEETRKLADIANDISDFETQLNLARDLKFKGMNELASATFNLGLSSAENFISENQDTYQALRARWVIEKYAYALEKFDWVEESANSILEVVDQLKKTPSEFKNLEKIEYIRSQTYLWLAKVCRKKKNYLESEKFLKKFIKNYPNDKEINYVMYELGRVYEDAMQEEKAIEAHRKVGNGMWKKKAEKRLSELGS